MLFVLPAHAIAQSPSDPRGSVVPWPDAQIPGNSSPTIAPLQPLSGFVSGGYRSIHFEQYFTSSFSFAFQITADNDTVFVSDATGNVVKMFQIIAGGVTFIRSFGAAGAGAGQFNGPEQVAVVGNDIYVADFGNNRIQRFNKNTGAYVSQFGAPGSGPGQLSGPSGLIYNPINGSLYVSEVGNDRVQIFSTAGIYQGQFSSLGSGNGQINNPYTLAIDSIGNIYVADSVNNRVVKFDSTGAWIRNIATGVTNPLGLAVDKSNMLWVTSGSGEIYVYDTIGSYNSYYYGSATTWQAGYFTGIRGIAVTPALTVAPYNGSSAVVVVDSGSQTVQLFSRSAQPTIHPAINGIPGVGTYTAQIAFDSAGDAYFASYSSNIIYKYDKFGTLLMQWGASGTGNGQFNGPIGIAVDDGGSVYVADRNNNRIQKFDGAGNYLSQFGTAGTGNGQFNHPSNIANDGAYLYITEEGNNRVQKFSLAGNYVRQWGSLGSGNGQFNASVGIAVDRNRQQVYVSEYIGNRIQQFTVFGDYIKILSDSGSGTGAVTNPLGLATDQHGNVYVADSGNARVVQFNDNGTYLTNFAIAGANGMGVNPLNAQIYVGTIAGSVISVFGSTIGKSDTIGLYRPGTQTFLLRNANTPGVPFISASVALAQNTDLPITGDWNGDGIDTPGLYRPGTATFYLWDRWTGLSIATADHTFALGTPAGERPISGDWDGDGADGIGVFRPSNGTLYLKNKLSAGSPEYTVTLGTAADIGVAGDWNQDGTSSAGIFRPSDGRFHLTNRNTIGVVTEDAGSYALGNSTDLPLSGDWTHSGYSGLGVFRPSTGAFYLKYNLDTTPADLVVGFGTDQVFRDGFEPVIGDLPLSGNWGAAPE